MSEQDIKSRQDLAITSVDVADIPYSSTDSHPPIVVDLPDGQKLVVGKLEAGTVIEVATWRGTGRPDSRTNRLMIGLSENETSTPEEPKLKRRLFGKNYELSSPTSAHFEPGKSADTETGTVKTGINQAFVQVFPVESKAPVSNVSSRRLIASRVRKWSIFVVILGLVVGVAGGPLNLRIVHPRSGVGTSLGSASSSIVVVHKSKTYKAGEKVVAGIVDTKRSPILGAIQVIDQGQVLVTTGPLYYSSETQKISGKVILVLPFFGWIVGLFA